MTNDEHNTLRAALQDMQTRARVEKRHLDVGILEAVLDYMQARGAPLPPLAPAPEVPAKGKRGRKPRETNGAPASVADLA